MLLAVTQLWDANGYGFGAFARQFFDGIQLLAELLRLEDLVDEFVGLRFVAVQQLVDGLLHPGDQVGADFGIAQLVLRLTLEDGIFEPNGDGAQ